MTPSVHTFTSVIALFLAMNSIALPVTNDPVSRIDPDRFAGRWYSLFSIPTFLDRSWRETVENYALRTKGGFDVDTTYRRTGESKIRHIRSTLFPTPGRADGELRAQFFWPIKVRYRIIELPDDYAYMVGGSPDKRMLFILSREPSLPKSTLNAILGRCRERGYAVDKLTSQEHPPKTAAPTAFK